VKVFTSQDVEKTLRAQQVLEIDPAMPSSNFSKLSVKLARCHASFLVQLQTRQIPLSKHLFKLGKQPHQLAPCATAHSSNKTVCISFPAPMPSIHDTEKTLKED